jgi:hypothetical protein
MQFFSLDPTNFRPISILSCLGKLFTAILNERLRRSSEEAFLLNENHIGFRTSYSTTDSIYVCPWRLLESFWHGMERCTMVHITLIHINGKRYNSNIILNMYKDVKSCVTYNYRKLGFFGCGYILIYLAPSMKSPKLNTPKNHMHQNILR